MKSLSINTRPGKLKQYAIKIKQKKYIHNNKFNRELQESNNNNLLKNTCADLSSNIQAKKLDINV